MYVVQKVGCGPLLVHDAVMTGRMWIIDYGDKITDALMIINYN